MEPGTMLLFEGRDSLHRVTPIIGSTPRYVALLAYDTKPATDSDQSPATHSAFIPAGIPI